MSFFFLFLIIYLYFLIPAVNAQDFNPTAKLTIFTLRPIYEATAKIGTHPLTSKQRQENAQSNLTL